MLSVTKIFRFEMGHAIHNYEGMCKYIHGHSYVLHVSLCKKDAANETIPAPGFVIDFKELKQLVNTHIIKKLDHALVLSKDYLREHPQDETRQNLLIWDYEPSAENILYFIRTTLEKYISQDYALVRLKLWETADSFAAWENPELI